MLLSTADVGTRLRITPQRVRQLIAEGVINAERVGRDWVISSEEVDRVRKQTTTSTIIPSKPKKACGKLHSLSFFSGAMGLDLGLEKAGISTELACESDKWARKTIAANRPDLPILGDIWRYTAQEIRATAGLSDEDEIDILAGGPPCQAFSTAGARRGFDDVRGNVFLRYVDLIKELRPKYAIIENVRGLLSMPVSPTQATELFTSTGHDFSKKHGAIQLVSYLLSEAGYSISFNLYNSANFGTPQIRERVVFIASREGGPVPYLEPTHSENQSYGLRPWKTVRQAFENMTSTGCHFIPFPEKRLKYYRMLGPGQYWKNLPENLQEEAMGKSFHLGGGKTGFYRRIAWDRPSPTLVTHPTMPATDLGHPVEDRPLSIEEYKAIQQFPDCWEIAGNLQQQYKQIGNAVPLSLGQAIGKAIIKHYNGIEPSIPADFRFSRYSKTSDIDLLPISSSSSSSGDTLF